MRTPAIAAVRSFESSLAGKSVTWLGRTRRVRLSRAALGRAVALEASVSPVRIAREADRVAEGWHLSAHLSGRGRYRLKRGWTDHRPGTVILLDAGVACAAEHPDGAHVVTWHLPADQLAPYLPAGIGPVEEISSGMCSVVGQHAVTLAREARFVEQSAAEGLVDNLTALVGVAVAATCAGGTEARPRHRAMMGQRVLAVVEARFRDPGLSAATAAEVLGVSRRWVHALLAESGAGFADRLRERRLAEGMRLLRDPGLDHVSVTEIGFAVGFNDLSTFHRQFRRRYGVTPGQARAERGE